MVWYHEAAEAGHHLALKDLENKNMGD